MIFCPFEFVPAIYPRAIPPPRFLDLSQETHGHPDALPDRRSFERHCETVVPESLRQPRPSLGRDGSTGVGGDSRTMRPPPGSGTDGFADRLVPLRTILPSPPDARP
ncbi:hypothetical protein Mal4_36740 [Maioricimonas rarisocia]|uniref:Uncharacterized protein n=1 Tax=Maioricimonas rarisocia TaxID=2528026 RepID=A0A517ZA28_9PLAN|nr:hypothetical protein Mal4_36740 [Maioricimonas rarisocia]